MTAIEDRADTTDLPVVDDDRSPVIEISNVWKLHKLGDEVVKALVAADLTVMPGEFVCLMGPSGSGKSTLLNMIGGLDRPTKGTIKVAGRDTSALTESQFAALRLVEQSGRQAGFEGVQFQLGDQALEAEDQAPIGSRRVVNTVLVADEAGAQAAQVEEVIPVGAVAGQAGDVVGEDDADLLLVDEGDEFLKALPSLGGTAGAAEVGIDDADLAGGPAGRAGTVLEGILEFKTLLIH